MPLIDAEKVDRTTPFLGIPIYGYSQTLWHEPLGLGFELVDAACESLQASVDFMLGAYSYSFTPAGPLDASLGIYPASPAQNEQWLITDDGTISGVYYRAGDVITYRDSAWIRTSTGYNPENPVGTPEYMAKDTGARGWVYESSFSVAAQETTPSGVFVNAAGTRMFVAGDGGNDITAYTLSTPGDVTTAVYLSVFSVATQTSAPTDLFFSTDGTVMFVGSSTTVIYAYTLSTPWDITTAVYLNSATLSAQETALTAFCFKPDGTGLYIIGTTADAFFYYTLSTPWDLTTLAYVSTFVFSSKQTAAYGLGVAPDGKSIFIVGITPLSLAEFSMSTAWDITTCAYVTQFSLAAIGAFSIDGSCGVCYQAGLGKAYVICNVNDRVFQFSVSPGAAAFRGRHYTFLGDVNMEDNWSVLGNGYVRGNFTADGLIKFVNSVSTPTINAVSATVTANLFVNTTSGAFNLLTGQTSSVVIFGGSAATGSITIGRSTAAQTINIATGVKANGVTAAVNIGTGGASGSTTNVVVGSSTSGSLGTFTLNLGFTTPKQIVSTLATGTSPFSVASTTLVTNLNAQFLNGFAESSFRDASNLSTGTLPLARLPGNTVGKNIVNLADPTAIRFLKINADNTATLLDDAAFRLAIGVATGTGSVVEIIAGDGLSGGSITINGTIAVDATVVRTSGAQTLAGVKTFSSQLISTLATGTSPFSVASTTLVANLNADFLDGQHGAHYLDWANQTNKPVLVTQVDAEAGTVTSERMWSPQRVNQAVMAAAGSATWVAEGTITGAGVVVQLRSDGKVEQVVGSAPAPGTAAVFESATTTKCASCYHVIGGKVIVVYVDGGNSNYLTAVVGTVSGTTITFGSPAVVYAADCSETAISYDTATGKMLIVYTSGVYGQCFLATLSGSTLTFYSGPTYNSSDGDNFTRGRVEFDPINGKFVIAYRRRSGGYWYAYAVVATVSGTTVSLGADFTVSTDSNGEIEIVYCNTEQKFVVVYNLGNGTIYTQVLTVSGTTLTSAGNSNVNAGLPRMVYDVAAAKLLFFRTGQMRTVVISGGTVTENAAVDLAPYSFSNTIAYYDSTVGKVVVLFGDAGNSYYATVATVELVGTVPRLDAVAVFKSANLTSFAMSSVGSGKSVVSYPDPGNSNYGTSQVLTVPTTNLRKAGAVVLGVAQAAAASGASVPAKHLGGMDSNQSGLAVNTAYFVSVTGALSTSSKLPNIKIGTGLSASRLLITAGV